MTHEQLSLQTSAPSPAPPPTAAGTTRLASLDIFRGLVIVVMTLVNYLSPVQGVPAWSKHWPESLDGYTYVDVVFPAFLFIVGVAIPFALGRRLSRGEPLSPIMGKIFWRSAVLILLGVITVNPHYFFSAGGLSEHLYFFLVMLCALAVFNSPPADASAAWTGARRLLQVSGAAGLLLLLALFRGRNAVGQTVWLQPAYWGMLGMIGWAYLLAALCWLLLRNRPLPLLGMAMLLLCFYIGVRHEALALAPLNWLGWTPNHYRNAAFLLGSNPATVIMGVLAGAWLQKGESGPHCLGFVKALLLFALGLYIAGLLLRPIHGIHKSDHTESYALVTGGISAALFALVYWLVEVKHRDLGSKLLTPLGQNALLAYILPEMIADGLGIFGVSIYWSKSGWSGTLNAFVLTIILLTVMWLLTRARIVMKL
jgi:heparan-alpha-glucosaminide N-acetyltransferase